PRSPDDVADVQNRTPRRTVALDINTSRCVRGSYEIVKHEIETQPGRRAISRGVSKIGRTKVLIGPLCYVSLDEYLRLSIRRDRIQRGCFIQKLVSRRAIRAARG